MLNNFAPHSRQQDERLITRKQDQFEAGGFTDIPASTIPDNGFVRIKNFVNFGRYLEGRLGTRELSATSLPGSGQVNSWIFHEKLKKIILHRGNSVYVADNLGVNWVEANREGIYGVTSYTSHMEIYKNFVYLFCGNGIFRIKVGKTPVAYTRINVEVPSNLITSGGSGDFEYRFVYAMSRLTGMGFRNRYTEGVTVEQETGTTEYNTTLDRDYGAVKSVLGISSGNPLTVSGLEVSTDKITDNYHTQFSHASVYRTLDLGDAGTNPTTNIKNNPELYIWVNDFPLAKAFKLTVSGTTATASDGTFEQEDVGAALSAYNGSGFVSGIIESYTSSTEVEVVTGFASGGVTDQPAGIGGGTVFSASQDGYNLTVSPTGLVSSGDIGALIFWANGTESLITDYVSGDVVTVDSSDSISEKHGTFGPTGRTFTTTVDDTALRNRIRDYSLNHRFWTHIPPCSVGAISNGFMFGAQRYRQELYYGQLVDDYMIGYHQPFYQFENEEDGITHLSIIGDTLVVYKTHSVATFPVNTYDTVTIQETGEFISVLSNRIEADGDRGVYDWGSIQKIGSGQEMMICDDYSIRTFNGSNFSDNIIRNKLMDEMKTLYPAFSSSYDEVNGYMWWGND